MLETKEHTMAERAAALERLEEVCREKGIILLRDNQNVLEDNGLCLFWGPERNVLIVNPLAEIGEGIIRAVKDLNVSVLS